MKLSRFAQNRVLICILLILVQMSMWVLFLQGLLDYWKYFDTIARLLSVAVVLYIISKNEETGYKMCWIMMLSLMPVFGGIMYVFFGDKKPSKRLRKKYDNQIKHIEEDEMDEKILLSIEDHTIQSQMRYITKEGFNGFENTATTYYKSGEDNFEALLEDLNHAKKFIFMEYFIVQEGYMFNKILDVLKRKVQEGVEVRFMYDDIGCLLTLHPNYYKKLESFGIKAVAFNKIVPYLALVMNNRDHRKITIIDGNVGYTGGINIADEYINKKLRFGHWKDTGIRLEGVAVKNLTKMFLTMWNVSVDGKEDFSKYYPTDNCIKSNGIVMPYGDTPLDNVYVGQDVCLNMINQASQYIYICTPYLIINEVIQTALILASRRGVDVRICTPGIPDKKLVFRVTRSYYGALLEAGVKIYEYTPGFLHAKNFVCDDKVATVGTVNMDYRSLFLHFECGVYMYNASSVMDIKDDFMDTISIGKEISKDDIVKGQFKSFVDALLRVIAPLL